MSITTKNLDGQNIALTVTAPDTTVDVLSVNVVTGEVTSAYLPAAWLPLIKKTVGLIFSVLPLVERNSVNFLERLVNVSAFDDSVLSLSSINTATNVYTLRLTVTGGVAPAHLFVNLPYPQGGGFAVASDVTATPGGPITLSGAVVGQSDNNQIADGAVTSAKLAPVIVDGLPSVSSTRKLGTGAQEAAAGNDPRIVNALDTATAAATYQTIAGMVAYLTTANAAATYLTQANAAATYQTIAAMTAYLTTASAAATYQTLAGMSAYAPLASPTFTGDPKAPTPATADNDTSIATTAFVKAQGYITALTAPVTSVAGKTGAVTLAVGDVSGAAPLASPTFTGTPSMPTGSTGVTQTAGDNSTKLSTTAYTDAAVAAAKGSPYDLSGDVYGTRTVGEVVYRFTAVRPIQLLDLVQAGTSTVSITVNGAPVTLPGTVNVATNDVVRAVIATAAGTDGVFFTVKVKVV